MLFKNSKFASMLTSAVLLATSLVTLSSAPASAAVTTEEFTSWSYPSANFGGNSSSLTSSPVAGRPTGTGDAVAITKGNQDWSGTTLKDLTGFEYISLPGAQDVATFSLEVYVPAGQLGKNVRLKFEDQADPNKNVNADFTTTVQGAWETATFTVSRSSVGNYWGGSYMVYPQFDQTTNYNRVSILVDQGGTTPGAVWIIDNFQYSATAVAVAIDYPVILSTFETSDTWSHDVNAVCSATAQVASNPPSGGSTGSAKAGKVTKSSNNDYCPTYPLWTFLEVPVGSSLLSTTNNVISLNFYSPTGGETPVFKFNTGPNNAGPIQASANETVVAGWQTLTFTFTGVNNSAQYRLASFFPLGTNAGANSTDYFFDDVSFNGAVTPQLTVQQQNQAQVTLSQPIQYAFETMPAGFEATDGGTVGIENTPADASAPTGTKSAYVTESSAVYSAAKLLRTGSEFISANSKVVQLRVKVPSTSTTVTLKLQDPDYNPAVYHDLNLFVEKTVTPGTTSWTVVEFNFAAGTTGNYSEGNDYTIGVLFFNVGVADPGTQKFFFDDVAFTPSVLTQQSSSVTPRTGENKGLYPHIRLDKNFLDTYLDATWWDGVWQYRDEDTRAYLKYIPVRSTFKLTYTVTDANNEPMANAAVTLIVNANYSCAKTYFMYENTLIGPDDCAGKGETQLPAKLTDSDGKVTFVLTNTNAQGEKMPSNLNGAPNGPELGTNIKPHLIGAKQEGIDMLFAHFVEPVDSAKIVAQATDTAKTGTPYSANFEFIDEAGQPMVNQLVEVYINGPDSKQDWMLTDAKGRVAVPVPNSKNLEGTTAVAVSVKRAGWLPMTATTMVTWVPGELKVSMAPASNSVEVKIVNAANQSVKIVINGKQYDRTPTTGLVTYKFPATVGKKTIRVTIGKKTYVRSVTVRR